MQAKSLSDKYTLFPINYPTLFELYKKQLQSFWHTEEVNMQHDVAEWELLSDNERFYIEKALAFFVVSDGIVNENLALNFYRDVEIPEARSFYAAQMAIEAIHCVCPDTLILSRNGYQKIKDFRNKEVVIWNGHEWSNVTVKLTGKDQRLFRVTLNNGMYLDCTSEHKWHIRGSNGSSIVTTKSLKAFDHIDSFEYPMFANSRDGDIFEYNETSPILSGEYANKENIIGWIQEFHTKYGVDTINDSSILVVEHCDRGLLGKIQLSLSLIGLESFVKQKQNTASTELDLYHLYINVNQDINHLEKGKELGRLFIKSVTSLCKLSDVYCFNEPINHTGIFNGIYTGQSEQYSLFIDTLIKDKPKRDELFNAIENVPAIKKKADWSLKWISDNNSPSKDLEKYKEIYEILKNTPGKENLVEAMDPLVNDSGRPFLHRLIAFLCVEAIFFSTSFAAFFWLKERNLLTQGLGTANELISKDENLHATFAMELYKVYNEKLPTDVIHSIFREAAEIEKEFATDSLPVAVIGMNSASMCGYVEYICDYWLTLLGYPKIYNTPNPLPFMEKFGLLPKVNQFERTITEYQKASGSRELVFDMDI